MKRPFKKGGADWSDADYLAYWKSKCVISAAGCWDWQGWCVRFNHQQPGQRGYAGSSYRGKAVRLNRKMLELKLGRPLALGEEACHTCDHKPCINPDHLYVGDRKRNCEDAQTRGRYWHQRKTHCDSGHEFTSDNTRIVVRGKYRFRQCKTCERIRIRLKAGWPKELAETLPAGRLGQSWKQRLHQSESEKL